MTTVTARPDFLTPANAARFADGGVAEAYPHRPPYAPEVVDVLAGLVDWEPRDAAILDIGAGTGDLARPLAARVARVDALDPSTAMVAKGRSLPGGDAPNLRWLIGRAEDAPLDGPDTAGGYALVTAGESLHWMDWETVLPRLAAVVAEGAVLAIVNREWVDAPWQDGLRALIEAHSTMTTWHTYDLIGLLRERGLFEPVGEWHSGPKRTQQAVDDYIESYHSRSSLTRAALSPESADAFDAGLRAAVAPWATDGSIETETISHITWGYPRGDEPC